MAEKKPGRVSADTLTKEEVELIRMWRSTNERGRQLILTAARISEGWRGGLRIVK